MLVAYLRNQSGIVDSYRLAVRGLPEGWTRISAPSVHLIPFGAASTEASEAEVEIELLPPRAPEAHARTWPIEVVAHSAAHDREVARARATVEIEPYYDLDAELHPQRASGRRARAFAITVRNRGNAPLQIVVSGIDAEASCRFTFDQQTFPADPGRRSGTAFAVRARKRIWIGRATDRHFEITAAANDADVAARPVSGVFRQRSWIPPWVAIALPLLLALGIFVLSRRPHTTTVPPLRGLSGIALLARLSEAGLQLGTVTTRATDAFKPGTVLDQDRKPGTKVGTNSKIAVEEAVGTGTVEVPNVVGDSLAEAEQRLAKAGLAVGSIGPEPRDPSSTTETVASQAPAAEQVVSKTQSVDLFFPDSNTPAKGVVPAIPVGVTAAAARAKIAAAGLDMQEVPIWSTMIPPGKIVAQRTARGTALGPGAPVTIVVSAGEPDIAYDQGGDIYIESGLSLNPSAKPAIVDGVQPSWGGPNGALVAYRRAKAANPTGQIFLADIATPTNPPRALSNPGFDDRRPAFSPDGKVVAFVRGTLGADYDLCFKRVASPSLVVACLKDPDITVSRPVWAPDGRAILMQARDTSACSDPQSLGACQTELLLYTSAQPDSARLSDWSKRTFISDSWHRSRTTDTVTWAAWVRRADGTQRLAMMANFASPPGIYRLMISSVQGDTQFSKPRAVPTVQGCFVSWRPDGGEVIVASDCSSPSSGIYRVDPSSATAQETPLAYAGADDPVWKPGPPTLPRKGG